MVKKTETGEDSPLNLEIINGKLVISIGINRLDGHEYHPTLPELKFKDRIQWVKDIIYELEIEEEDGSTALTDLLDSAMCNAIENGSTGVSEDSPTHIGTCQVCSEIFSPLRHTRRGQTCQKCS